MSEGENGVDQANHEKCDLE